jgi:hypothetical protein
MTGGCFSYGGRPLLVTVHGEIRSQGEADRKGARDGARRAATSVLLSLTADSIRIPTDNMLRGNATVTEASFSVEGSPVIVRTKRVKQSATKRR